LLKIEDSKIEVEMKKTYKVGQVWWQMDVIPAMQKVETGISWFEIRPGKKVRKIL
jgi:hypothetical protein